MSKRNGVEVELEFTDEQLIKIDELRKRWELESNADVVEYCVAAMMKIVDSMNEGNKIKLKANKFKFPSGYIETFII
jgi:hypothetical protein